MKKLILAIETSCDETALAVVKAEGPLSGPRFRVLKSVIASQIKIHAPFGGVVPNLAKREHIKNLPILLRKIFGIPKSEFLISKKIPSPHFPIEKIDLIAVTVGPGLEPALWAGITFAKEVHRKLSAISHKPIALIGANHLEGHLYSFLLVSQKKGGISKSKFLISNTFPAIALIVSGGHTILLRLDNLTSRKKLGETRDDAAGECFDKMARLLKLPYPGGPELEKLAKKGRADAILFPRPMVDQRNYDFSFSGLKTSVLYYLRDNPKANKANVAASAQEAIIDVLTKKTMRAAVEFGAHSVLLSGGVAANRALRKRLSQESKKRELEFFVPDFNYNTDNAVMVAVASYINFLQRKKYALAANGGLSIT